MNGSTIWALIDHFKEQDIKMSNFTHTLVKNKKEIQIFYKICQNINSFNHFIINQSGNPSTTKHSIFF